MDNTFDREIIVVRFGELFLKGNNRAFFERLLIKNIKAAVSGYGCTVKAMRGRYTVEGFEQHNRGDVMAALKTVFGIHSLSFARETNADIESIYALCKAFMRSGTFKVEAKRADKGFPMTSMQICTHIGSRLLQDFAGAKVDVHNPENTVRVDIRENGRAFVYGTVEEGAGGMPVGSSGKGMLMLSGGIDSPVAGYLMARRGMQVCAVHYHSYPYTSLHARQKVISLAQKLAPYLGGIKLYIVPFTEIQQSIHNSCRAEYMITIMRRFMVEIAQRLSEKEGAGALINGESLGQVASQTLESITVTEDVAKIPIFRPLIGLDKLDIIKLAQKIDTYQTSILPYEDCCTVFLPKNPVIKPKLADVLAEEQALSKESLIGSAVEAAECMRIPAFELKSLS